MDGLNESAAQSHLPESSHADAKESPVLHSAPPLTFNPDEYRKFLEGSDLTEDRQRELLESLWVLVVAFVDMGFGIHPIQHVLDGREKMLVTDSATGVESSSTRKKQSDKAARAFSRAAGKRDS